MRPRLKIKSKLHNQLPLADIRECDIGYIGQYKILKRFDVLSQKKPITVFFSKDVAQLAVFGAFNVEFSSVCPDFQILSHCFVFTNSMHGERAAERAFYSRQDVRPVSAQWVTKVTSVHVQWCSPGHRQLNNISIYMCMQMYQRISNGLNQTLVNSIVGPLRLTQMEVVCLLFVHRKLSPQNSVQALEIKIVFLPSFLIQSYYDTGLNRLSFACSSVFL